MLDFLFKVSWYKIFAPSLSVTELFIRGTFVYLMMFAYLRFLPSRQVGGVGLSDVLVIILLANAGQNAMASTYTSITDGVILVSIIVFWSYALNWLGYRSPVIQRLLSPPPLILVKNGRMIRRNMNRELLTDDELMVQLRKQGIEKLENVKMAFMEADGSISIISYEQEGSRPVSKKLLR